LLVLAATAPELKSWAVAVAQLGDWLHSGTDDSGMDYTRLNGTDGEVQVFTDYQRRVQAAGLARREVLAGPARELPPGDQGPLIRQRGAMIRSRPQPDACHDAVQAAP
jgi:hypothetical protein